jgi:hypothetical protein
VTLDTIVCRGDKPLKKPREAARCDLREAVPMEL